ncbi:MAG: phosphoglycerate mutase family protein [Bacteroidales bacterium]|nr:phosphoglycerate mutase family protein [Bacteroidales bacterium]
MHAADILALAEANQRKAMAIIERLDIPGLWQSVGAEARLVGSLKMGLLMKHRDIDFHIYSAPLRLEDSFQAMSRLTAHPEIRKIECINLMHTEEACIEWHATYEDADRDLWQIDLIHILKGSRYDGYFERMAERITARLTPATRQTILQLKYETPDEEKIMGVEYYRAVLEGGVSDYAGFQAYRAAHPVEGILEWMP